MSDRPSKPVKPMNDHNTNDELRTLVLDTAGRLFADRVDADLCEQVEAGEWPQACWDDIVAMGLPRILLAEEDGGTGLGAADSLALVERAGYYALPLPLGETLVGNHLRSAIGCPVDDAPVALVSSHDTDGITLIKSGDGWQLSGRLCRVAWARFAPALVMDVDTDQGATQRICLASAGLDWRQDNSLAGEPRDSATLDGLNLGAGRVAPLGDNALSITHWGALIRALQMAGAARRALELAVEYANDRKQFGRPIARFQAVQQQLAAMAGHIAVAGAAADAGSRSLGSDSAPLMIAIAKARVGEAASQAAAIAHQVTAAMGFTREHSLHNYSRRIWAWRDEHGAEPYWQAEIGRAALAAGGDGLWPFISERT